MELTLDWTERSGSFSPKRVPMPAGSAAMLRCLRDGSLRRRMGALTTAALSYFWACCVVPVACRPGMLRGAGSARGSQSAQGRDSMTARAEQRSSLLGLAQRASVVCRPLSVRLSRTALSGSDARVSVCSG